MSIINIQHCAAAVAILAALSAVGCTDKAALVD